MQTSESGRGQKRPSVSRHRETARTTDTGVVTCTKEGYVLFACLSCLQTDGDVQIQQIGSAEAPREFTFDQARIPCLQPAASKVP